MSDRLPETTLTDVYHSNVLRASIVANMITQTLSHPFEYVKTGQQLTVGKEVYRMFDSKATLFFAGLAPINLSCIGTNFIKFYTYPLVVNFLNRRNGTSSNNTSNNTSNDTSSNTSNNNMTATTAGVITGFFEGLFMIPFENIKNRMIYNAHIKTQREQEVNELQKIVQDLEKDTKNKHINSDLSSNNVNHEQQLKRTPLNKAMKYAKEVEELSKKSAKKISFDEIAKEDAVLSQRLKDWKLKADYYYEHPSTKFHNVLNEIWQVSSFRGFAQASYLTIFQHMTTVAIQFTALNYFISLKNANESGNKKHILFQLADQYEAVQFFMPMVYGVSTSALTVLVSQPLDVVRSRMQSTKFSPFQTWIRDIPNRTTFVNTFQCFHQTYLENNAAGMVNFYKGWLPRLIRLSILNSGIGFGFYFHFQTGLENYLKGQEQPKTLES